MLLKLNLNPMYKFTTNLHILPFKVVDTLVGRAAPKFNLGRVGGWLEGEARRNILRKVRAEACS
jgi:hypothetical protein